MSGNQIRVVCRFRPQNSKEIKAKGKVVVDFLDEQTVHLNVSEFRVDMAIHSSREAKRTTSSLLIVFSYLR